MHPVFRRISFFTLLLLLSLFISPVYSQFITPPQSQQGYIVTGNAYKSAYTLGASRYQNNRKIAVRKNKSDTVERYTPDQLVEYGLDKGQVYESIQLPSGERFFLLKLASQKDGSAALYNLKVRGGQRFYIRRDSVLIELNKKSNQAARAALETVFSDCEHMSNALIQTRLNSGSLLRLYQHHKQCKPAYFASLKFGVKVGYTFLNIGFDNPQQEQQSNLSAASFVAGVFADMPLEKRSRLSFAPEILYKRFQNNGHQEISPQLKWDFWVDQSCIDFPILFKYRSTAPKVRGFVIGGPTFSYVLSDQSKLMESRDFGSVIEIDKFQFSETTGYAGGLLGAGVEMSVSYRSSLAFEARYQKSAGIAGETTQQSWQLMLSFNF